MNKETMSVHKALSELKTLESRINGAIDEGVFVEIKKHGAENIRGMSVQQVTDYITASYKSVTDLIARRNAIKRAVVLSNAVTKVTIAGVEYTVAEAIDMKNHGLDGKYRLLNTLRSQFKSRSNTAERNNDALESRADTYIKDLYGSTDMTKVGEDAKKARKDFIAAQTVELVDPLGVLKEIERLDGETSAFMVEVDSALSVSNAVTEITIEY